MLVCHLTSLEEATIAERVRDRAALTTADHALTEQAVDEAIRTFRAQDAKHKDLHGAVFAGLLFLNDMLLHAQRVEAMRALRPVLTPVPVAKERVPCAWAESWTAIGIGLLLSGALIWMGAAGVLP